MVCVAFSADNCPAMAAILPPEIPTSASVVSIAVTIVPFLMIVSNRMQVSILRGLGCRSRNSISSSPCRGATIQRPSSARFEPPIVRQNLPLVHFQGFFLFPTHQINIKLRDSNAAQSFQLLPMLIDRPNQTKAVNHLIANEIGIVAADFAMMKIIVLTTILHKRSQRSGQLFRLVLRNQIDNVIGHQRREPANSVACKC